MEIWQVILIILAVFGLLIGITIYIMLRVAFHMTIERSDLIDPKNISKKDYYFFHKDLLCTNYNKIKELPFKEYVMKNGNGHKLYGYFLSNPKNNTNNPKVVLFVHAWRSSGVPDLSFIGNFYYDFNYDVCTYDQEGCGKSEGKFTNFGTIDYQNLILWVQKINEIYNHQCEIIIHGLSTGATTALLVSNEYLENVLCIISDSAFITAYQEILFQGHVKLHIPTCLVKLYRSYVKKRCHYDLDSIKTTDVVKNSKYPILFIHGRKDSLVPFSMAEENYRAANCYKDLYVTEVETHATSYLREPIAYEQTVLNFIYKCEQRNK